MNKQEREAANRNWRNANSDDLVEVPRERWPVSWPPQYTQFACYCSKRFIVQLFNEKDGIKRLTVCRAELDTNGQWKANITWDELQAIKNEVGFAEFDAVEVFPHAQHVVNIGNMRHLWILPELLDFGL